MFYRRRHDRAILSRTLSQRAREGYLANSSPSAALLCCMRVSKAGDRSMRRTIAQACRVSSLLGLMIAFGVAVAREPGGAPATGDGASNRQRLAEFFRPPQEFAGDLGDYRSPLKFADGYAVRTAEDWQRRRGEILKTWHELMGPWP